MKNGLLKLLKRAFRSQPVHPVESGMAKRWVKQRLLANYPELRNNPAALERAYRTLNLEARAGDGADEPNTVFEITLPERE
jgi:hypothetical protein